MQLLNQWARMAIFQKVNRPRREANHLPLSAAMVKRGGVIPPFRHVSTAQFVTNNIIPSQSTLPSPYETLDTVPGDLARAAYCYWSAILRGKYF
jgi:hypothetical protein